MSAKKTSASKRSSAKDKSIVVRAKEVQLVEINSLTPYENNARTHSEGQLKQLTSAIRSLGFNDPLLVDENNMILSGHGRWEAAKRLGMTEVPCVRTEGMTMTEKRQAILAFNRIAQNAGWDNDILTAELTALYDIDIDLDVLGFNEEFMSDLLDPAGSIDQDDDETPEEETDVRGQLLGLVNVSIDEPKHQTKTGDVWQLGDHVLVVGSVMNDWQVWSKFLKDDSTIFAPYPGPLVPLTSKAKSLSIVMVHPDTYVAGHILDHYVEAYGDSSISRIEVAQ